jgi:hypothetical protein
LCVKQGRLETPHIPPLNAGGPPFLDRMIEVVREPISIRLSTDGTFFFSGYGRKFKAPAMRVVVDARRIVMSCY